MVQKFRSLIGSMIPWLAAAVLALSACAPAGPSVESAEPVQSLGSATVTGAPEISPLPTIALSQEAPPNALPTVSFAASPIPSPVPPTSANIPGTPEAGCFVTAGQEGLRLNPGPFISVRKILPTMEPHVPYEVVDVYPTFQQLARDGQPVGWIEYMTTGLSGGGAGCAALFNSQPATRSLTDFPGLCFFTVERETGTFSDSSLTQPHVIGLEPSSQPLVVLWKSEKSIFTSFGHAGPSFYVPADQVNISGDCESIPAPATVTATGWLWTEPDAQQGEKLIALAAGQSLQIEGLRVQGARPPESNAEGEWLQAVVDGQDEPISGWVWSGLLSFE